MKDLFSHYAREYAVFRPHYPQELYDCIYSRVKKFDTAWDAGTGSGQAAIALSSRFKTVYATDISAKQLDNAKKSSNIFYSEGEVPPTQPYSINLITVAQAIHWFDRQRFYESVRLFAKPGATIAVWGYGLAQLLPAMQQQLEDFYIGEVGSYWDPERKLIDEHYRTLDFPFPEFETPVLNISLHWSLEEFQGYLSTWSAVQKFTSARGFNPVGSFIDAIRPLWGQGKRMILFPLFLRLGEVTS